MLNFANFSGDADSKIVRETWARLIDQAISSGGIAEACNVLKRVGSNLYPVDRSFIPLDTLCLHLEKAALVKPTWISISLVSFSFQYSSILFFFLTVFSFFALRLWYCLLLK